MKGNNFKPRIKVCGLTQHEQVYELIDMDVDFAGFIFYPKSPRYVFRHLSRQHLKNIKAINKVGVFVNDSIDDVLRIVDDCRLHLVQLHGDETPKYCEKIADYVSVIKAFRIGENDNIAWRTKDYIDMCDMFLFDTDSKKTEEQKFGGTGEKFSWKILQDAAITKPYLLSGGIGPADVEALKTFAHNPQNNALIAIDVNSKFETSPGIKNTPIIKTFIDNLYNRL
jgi:phosphoribosylanthranilate isomerase